MDDATTGPLLVTDDQELRGALLRLAAASGVTPDVASDSAAALRAWTSAPVVVLGADLVGGVANLRPPRRPGVHVVTTAVASDDLYRAALDCGAEGVVVLPGGDDVLTARLADSGDVGAGPGIVVGVVGGAGGVGATTFAAALAVVLAGQRPTLLVDADPLGGGIDRVLGLDDAPGSRWDALLPTAGRLTGRSLAEALPRQGALSVLAWPADRSGGLPLPTFREVLAAGRRGYPVVVLDLPRHPDAAAAEALLRCDVVLLVVTATLPAVSAAARIAARLPAGRAAVVLRGGPASDRQEIERVLGLRVVASLSDERGLDESIGLGLGPVRRRRGPLARTCAAVASEVLHGGLLR